MNRTNHWIRDGELLDMKRMRDSRLEKKKKEEEEGVQCKRSTSHGSFPLLRNRNSI